jgi:hypothetical protein
MFSNIPISCRRHEHLPGTQSAQMSLWQCTHRHFSVFLPRYPEDYQSRHGPVRPTIRQAVGPSPSSPLNVVTHASTVTTAASPHCSSSPANHAGSARPATRKTSRLAPNSSSRAFYIRGNTVGSTWITKKAYTKSKSRPRTARPIYSAQPVFGCQNDAPLPRREGHLPLQIESEDQPQPRDF